MSDFHGPRGLQKLGRFGPSCLLKLGRLGPSCLGPTFFWAELSWADLSLGRVVRNSFCKPHWPGIISVSMYMKMIEMFLTFHNGFKVYSHFSYFHIFGHGLSSVIVEWHLANALARSC